MTLSNTSAWYKECILLYNMSGNETWPVYVILPKKHFNERTTKIVA